MATWDEKAHPRQPAGQSNGGEFRRRWGGLGGVAEAYEKLPTKAVKNLHQSYIEEVGRVLRAQVRSLGGAPGTPGRADAGSAGWVERAENSRQALIRVKNRKDIAHDLFLWRAEKARITKKER